MNVGLILGEGAKLQPRKYLKNVGFMFDVKPAQLDKRFFKMLTEEDQSIVKNVWAAAEIGLDISTQLYSVPKTLKQACALFSHDAMRYVVSMSWIASLVETTAPTSIMEMGCGAGLLQDFIKKRFPAVKVNGIDSAENLVQIGSKMIGHSLCSGDYLSNEPDGLYDLVVCEFGYDNSNIPQSTTPHSSGQCGPASYCPGCAKDAQGHFRDYMRAWRRWGTQDGALGLVGRMTDYTDVRAVTLAARDEGWYVSLKRSEILTIKDARRGSERFPAWYFTSDKASGASEEAIANFYVTGRRARQ